MRLQRRTGLDVRACFQGESDVLPVVRSLRPEDRRNLTRVSADRLVPQMPRRLTAGLLLVVALLFAQSPEGQPLDEIEDPGLIITAETSLVVVPLHVYKKKVSIGGLDEEAFELLEDGELQEIAFVEGPPDAGEDPSSGRSVPVEIILLIDISHSVMRRGLLDVDTIRAGILEEVSEHVSISIYGFAGKLTRFTGPTSDISKLERALELAQAAEHGQTRIYESIVQTARDASERSPNATRMMVVFSDGFSTSDFESEWAHRAGNHFGIPLYPVVLGHQQIVERARRRNAGIARRAARGRPSSRPTSPGSSRTYEQELRQKEFADLGALTGGRSYDLKNQNSAAVRSILKSLATLAQTEYVVGYYPRRSGEESTARRVEVRLKDKSIGKLYGGRRVVVH